MEILMVSCDRNEVCYGWKLDCAINTIVSWEEEPMVNDGEECGSKLAKVREMNQGNGVKVLEACDKGWWRLLFVARTGR